MTTSPLPLLGAAALTAYERCPRLFRYLHIEQSLVPLPWEEEAHERAHRRFRHLVALAGRGRTLAPLIRHLDEETLSWWKAFLQSPHARPAGHVYEDHPLLLRRGRWRLVVRLHRLVVTERQAHICFWHTGPDRPDDEQIQGDWQMRIAPLLLCLVGSSSPGSRGQIAPEQVSLTLWFARHPERPFEIRYSRQALQEAQASLDRALDQLERDRTRQFPMTEDRHTCESCPFRVRCWGLGPVRAFAEPLGRSAWPEWAEGPEAEGWD